MVTRRPAGLVGDYELLDIFVFQLKYEKLASEKLIQELDSNQPMSKGKKKTFFQKAFGLKNEGQYDANNIDADNFSTQEEKDTGFYLPGFFEVFPELKLKWPKWARRKDGSTVECETDRDCRFPQACCFHPIVPGKKFCCTGWTQRIMIPAYVGNEILADDNARGDYFLVVNLI